jgi:hypothetical protein
MKPNELRIGNYVYGDRHRNVVTVTAIDARHVVSLLDEVVTTENSNMGAEDWIIQEYGNSWLVNDWNPGDVITALTEFANQRIKVDQDELHNLIISVEEAMYCIDTLDEFDLYSIHGILCTLQNK